MMYNDIWLGLLSGRADSRSCFHLLSPVQGSSHRGQLGRARASQHLQVTVPCGAA